MFDYKPSQKILLDPAEILRALAAIYLLEGLAGSRLLTKLQVR